MLSYAYYNQYLVKDFLRTLYNLLPFNFINAMGMSIKSIVCAGLAAETSTTKISFCAAGSTLCDRQVVLQRNLDDKIP